MKKFRLSALLISLVAVFLMTMLSVYRLSAKEAPMQKRALVENALLTNCRYGAASLFESDVVHMQELGLGALLDFSHIYGGAIPAGIEFVPMIRLSQLRDELGNRLSQYEVTPSLSDDPAGLGTYIQNNPGSLWLVGNEVDRVGWQDDMMPNLYASAYHEVYHFIKTRDPSARVAISGLVEVTPGRLQYLDIVWDTYKSTYGASMPVDVWNMHVYILPERRLDGEYSRAGVALGTDPELAIFESDGTLTLCDRDDVYCYAEHDNLQIFADQVVAMRQWMKAHSQQNKPLILSEFSLLYPYTDEGDNDPNTCYLQDENGLCFTPSRVTQFMIDAFNYLETAKDPNLGYPIDNNKLVQQWFWYAINEPSDLSSNRLVTIDGTQLTSIGETFRDEIARRGKYTSLRLERVDTTKVIIPDGQQTIDGIMRAYVRNNGNTTTWSDSTVYFYSDAGLTNLITTVPAAAGVPGCALHSVPVTGLWPALAPGAYPYWAKLNQEVQKGIIFVAPDQLYLPVIIR